MKILLSGNLIGGITVQVFHGAWIRPGVRDGEMTGHSGNISALRYVLD